MKTDSKKKMILGAKIIGLFLLICVVYGTGVYVGRLIYDGFVISKTWNENAEIVLGRSESIEVNAEEKAEKAEVSTPEVEESFETTESHIVYDNMTIEELAAKLDRSLNSTLAGKGYLFATTSLELGVDPYLAVAIALEETGCKWNCSGLVKQCNNVGGQKGGTVKCNGGSYRYYPTLDEGIYGFIDNLARNYYAIGLTTPEAMNSKYAESTSWATKVNNYIAAIRAA